MNSEYLQSTPLATEPVKLKNVDTEAKFYVILTLAILNAVIWCDFLKNGLASVSTFEITARGVRGHFCIT